DARAPGYARARAHEAQRDAGERGARGDRRRGRALPGAGRPRAGRRRARRVVSLPEDDGADGAVALAVPRAVERSHDAARLGLDGGHAGHSRDADCRQHRAHRSWRAPAESHRPAGLIALRLPFFYGWVVIAVAFVTMGVGVNARTSFS